MAPLSCYSCLIFIGHDFYHKLILSDTHSAFPVALSGTDSHVIHILQHIELVVEKHLGE